MRSPRGMTSRGGGDPPAAGALHDAETIEREPDGDARAPAMSREGVVPAEAESKARVPVCSFEELERERRRVVSVDGRPVLLLLEQGQVFALDNRCPHMGFPLHRGTVKDGILTCHWHHARFDLAGGCTFDPFADDVPSYHAEVRDGEIWLCPCPIEEERRGHWMRKLEEGLEQN